jgi:WD40 repeat protein/tetratricopeptide (TPR) repeat protein
LAGTFVLLALAAGISGYSWLDAESARDEAIAERDRAQEHELLAKQKADEAEAAQVDAEKARDDAETAQVDAEMAREEAEAAQEEAVKARERAEADRTEAQRQKTLADQALLDVYRSRSELSNKLTDEGDPVTASLLALASLPDEDAASTVVRNRPLMMDARQALERALGAQRERMVVHGHEGQVYRALFSPDGARFLTVSSDGTARLWNVKSGEEITFFGKHEGNVWSAEFSSKGDRVLTASSDGTARIWDASAGEELKVFPDHGGPIYSARFSPDESRVLTGGQDDLAKLWDAETGDMITTYEGHDQDINTVEFSADGKLVLTGSDDATARIWETDTGKEILVLEGHAGGIYDVAFSANGTKVLTASVDTTARLWDAKTGKPIKSLDDHEKTVNSARFLSDTSVLTASSDGTARIWDVDSAKSSLVIKLHRAQFLDASVSPDGQSILTGVSDGTARLWDMDARHLPNLIGRHADSIQTVAVSRDGLRVLITSYNTTAQIWDVNSSASLRTLHGHMEPLTSGKFSADGQLVLTASYDGTARLWNADTGEPTGISVRHDSTVNNAAFSPDETRIVTASDDWSAKIWDRKTGKTLLTLQHDGAVKYAVISGDGNRAFTAVVDGSVHMWDIASGTLLKSYSEHSDRVWQIAFSKDGKGILTASSDNTAILRDVVTGRVLRIFAGHEKSLFTAVISPNGRQVLTASNDGTARLWDIETGKVLRVMSAGGVAFHDAEFMPDGNSAVTVSAEGDIHLWRVFPTTQAAVSHAKDTLVRCLTPDQRSIFYLPSEFPPTCKDGDKWPHNSPLFHIGEGRRYLGDDQDDSARAHFEIALEQRPDTSATVAEVYANRGRTRLLDEKDEAAATDFLEAKSINPERSAKYDAILAAAYAERAQNRIGARKDDAARSDLAAALRHDPANEPEYRKLYAQALVERGRIYLNDDIDDKAEWTFEAALTVSADVNSEVAGAYRERGLTRRNDSKYAQALQDFERALAYNPEDPRALVGRAATYDGLERYDDALADVDAVIRRDPDYPLAHNWRGWILLNQREFQSAVSAYSQAIRHENDDQGHYIGRAVGQLSLLRLDEARSDIERARQLGDDDALQSVFEQTLQRTVAWRFDTKERLLLDLLIVLNAFTRLSAPEIEQVTPLLMRRRIHYLHYPIANLFVEMHGPWTQNAPVHQCDNLAAHIADPYRVKRHGVDIMNVMAPDTAISACTEAIQSENSHPRFYLQRSRAYGRVAQLAQESEDEAGRNHALEKELADLQHLVKFEHRGVVGYAMAFNNLAVLHGRRPDSNEEENLRQVGENHLTTFNRVTYCCGVHAAEALLSNEIEENRDVVRHAVQALIDWGSALGDPAAHAVLADLVADGTLRFHGRADTVDAFAYRHLLIADRLYRERAARSIPRPVWDTSPTDLERAKALTSIIAEFAGRLSAEEAASLRAEASGFVAQPLDASPPWLSTETGGSGSAGNR